MPDSVNDIILEEVRGLRREVNEGFSETRQRLTAVESQTQPFFANDGDKQKMEGEIKNLQNSKNIMYGGVLTLTGLSHWLMHKLGI